MKYQYKYSNCIEQNELLNLKILELMIEKDLKPLIIFFGSKSRWLKRNESYYNQDDQYKDKGKGKAAEVDNENIISKQMINDLKDQLEKKINSLIDKKLAENYFIFNKKIGNTYFIEYALSYFPYPYVIHQLMEHYISIIPKKPDSKKTQKTNVLKEKVLSNFIKSSSNLYTKDDNGFEQWKDSSISMNLSPIENQRENAKKKHELYRGRSMINPSTQLITEEKENFEMDDVEENKELINSYQLFENDDDFIHPLDKYNFIETKPWQSDMEMYDDNKNSIPNIDFEFKHSHSLENVRGMKNNKNDSLLSLAIRNRLSNSIIEILLKFSVSTAVPPKNIGITKGLNNAFASDENISFNIIKKARYHFNANYLIYACKNDTHGNKNDLVKLLLKYNINPNSQDELGKTALMYCIENSDIAKIKMLLNYIHITTDLILGLIFFGRSRARIKNKDLVRYIEICGGKVDLNIRDNAKKNAFDYVCIYKNEAIIKLVLTYIINRNKLRKKYNNYSYSNINIRNSVFLRGGSYSNFNLKNSSYFKNGNNNFNKGNYHNYSNYNSNKNLKEGMNVSGSNSDVYNSNIKDLRRYNSNSNNSKSVYELNKSNIHCSTNNFSEKIKFSENDKTVNHSSTSLLYKSNTNVIENDDNYMFYPISMESIRNLIMISINRNYTEIIKILLRNGLNPDIMDDEGNNLLLILANKYIKDKNERYYNLMKLLLQYHAKIDITNNNNISVFKKSIYHSKKILNLLLNYNNTNNNNILKSKSPNNVEMIYNDDDSNSNFSGSEMDETYLNEKFNLYDTNIDRIVEQNDGESENGTEDSENILKEKTNEVINVEKSNKNNNTNIPNVVIHRIATLIRDKGNKEMILYLAIWYESMTIINSRIDEWKRQLLSFDLDIALILALMKENDAIITLLLSIACPELIEPKQGKWKLLHYLCETPYYNEKLVNFLLGNHADLNYKNTENQSPLQLAIRNKNFLMMKLLLEHQVKLPNSTETGEPFFISIVKSNNLDMVKYVLDHINSLDIHELDEYDNNALMVSCKYGNADIAKIILPFNYNINDEDIYGNTALILACQNGHLEIVKLLINQDTLIDKTLDKSLSSLNFNSFDYAHLNANNNEEENVLVAEPSSSENSNESLRDDSKDGGIKINKKNNRGMTAFVMSCQHGNLQIIQYLLEYIDNINEKCHDGSTGLMVACYNNQENIIQYLLDHGADPNEQDSTGNNSLIYACQMGNSNVVNLLLDHPTNIDINMTNRNSNTALMYACQHGYEDIVKKLLQHHADINIKDCNENTALLYSIRNEFHNISVLLIENGADVNCMESENKSTALMIACQTKQHEVINALLEKNAELNIQNKYGYCPLLIAIENNDEKLVDILLKYNANVNVYDTYGNNTLMLACSIGNKKIVESLLNHQGSTLDINERNFNNNTAVHNACECGNYDIVNLLLNSGATINNVNDNGQTELAIAGQNNYIGVVKLLLEKQASLSIENFLKINQKGYYAIQKLILDANALLITNTTSTY